MGLAGLGFFLAMGATQGSWPWADGASGTPADRPEFRSTKNPRRVEAPYDQPRDGIRANENMYVVLGPGVIMGDADHRKGGALYWRAAVCETRLVRVANYVNCSGDYDAYRTHAPAHQLKSDQASWVAMRKGKKKDALHLYFLQDREGHAPSAALFNGQAMTTAKRKQHGQHMEAMPGDMMGRIASYHMGCALYCYIQEGHVRDVYFSGNGL